MPADVAQPSLKQHRNRLIPSRRQVLWAFAIAAILLIINDLFFFESVLIPSSSMRPTLLPNERALVCKLPYRTIHRFDVVAIHSHALGKRIAKRIVALPGERVRVEDSWKVFVNGEPLQYAPADAAHCFIEGGNHVIQVVPQANVRIESRFGSRDVLLGPGEYFVLGDNRLASDDSRTIGPVLRSEIEGKFTLIWYSFDLQDHKLRSHRMGQSIR